MLKKFKSYHSAIDLLISVKYDKDLSDKLKSSFPEI